MNFTDNLFRSGSSDEHGAFGNYAKPLADTYADDAVQDSAIAIGLPTGHFRGYAKPVSEAYSGWYQGVSKLVFGYRDATDDKAEFGVRDFDLNEPADGNQTGFINRFTSIKKDTDNTTYYNFLTQKNDLPDFPEDKPFRHSGNPLAKELLQEEQGINLSLVNTKYTTGFGYMPSGGFFKGFEL